MKADKSGKEEEEEEGSSSVSSGGRRRPKWPRRRPSTSPAEEEKLWITEASVVPQIETFWIETPSMARSEGTGRAEDDRFLPQI